MIRGYIYKLLRTSFAYLHNDNIWVIKTKVNIQDNIKQRRVSHNKNKVIKQKSQKDDYW